MVYCDVRVNEHYTFFAFDGLTWRMLEERPPNFQSAMQNHALGRLGNNLYYTHLSEGEQWHTYRFDGERWIWVSDGVGVGQYENLTNNWGL